MRMWMIKPSLLCKKHLLGEHGEIHKHRHNFEKKHSITKRIEPIAQIHPARMQERHEQLVEEMHRRGFNHASPYEQPDISYLPVEQQNPIINVSHNLQDLCNRCEACKERIIREYA